MTHPSLTEQIDAVERAADHYSYASRHLVEMGAPIEAKDDVEKHASALAAAAETLKTLEFAREVMN